MGKRRRERDRPKAGPEAAYDPNKRVLLTYESDRDDEDGEVADARKQPSAAASNVHDARVANYQMDEYPDDEQESEANADSPVSQSSPAQRQRHANRKEGGDSAVRPQHGQRSNLNAEIKKNKSTNQVPSLGLLSYAYDDDAEDEEYDSTTEEAMAYLKAVRSERLGIPEILTAVPALSRTDPKVGAPIGEVAEESPTTTPENEDDLSGPQRAFTNTLKERFMAQRRKLHTPPTVQALTALTSSHPISFPRGNNKAYVEWHRLMSSKPPQLAQLQSLEQETVYDLLALLQRHFLLKDKSIGKLPSSWLWSLLAKLDDVGNMNNDQVYPLRELGKRAVFLQLCITCPNDTAQLEDMGQGGSSDLAPANGDEISLEEDLAAIEDERVAGMGDGTFPKPVEAQKSPQTDNTEATLDMILVVVGEIYGQRDLLKFRQSWTGPEKHE